MNEYYRNKETGEIENIKSIKKKFEELLGNTNEFEEYRNNFSKFLENYYIKVEGAKK